MIRRDARAGWTARSAMRAEGFRSKPSSTTPSCAPGFAAARLVDLDGKAIGLNIARASRVSTYALPARLAQRILANLQSHPPSAAR